MTLVIEEGGPGGIRTRDLFSAIEARSQLRHRPRLLITKSRLFLDQSGLYSGREGVSTHAHLDHVYLV